MLQQQCSSPSIQEHEHCPPTPGFVTCPILYLLPTLPLDLLPTLPLGPRPARSAGTCRPCSGKFKPGPSCASAVRGSQSLSAYSRCQTILGGL